MHTELSILDVIFRFSLFFLLVYKIYDLITTYAIPYIFDHIMLERKYQTELLAKDKLLLSTRHRIENQIHNQKQIFLLLEKKVQMWRNAQKEEQLLIEQENHSLVKKIEERRARQKRNIDTSATMQLSIPSAINEAFLELKRRHRTDKGKEILVNVISNMRSAQQSSRQDGHDH